jgi:hypothetical protein
MIANIGIHLCTLRMVRSPPWGDGGDEHRVGPDAETLERDNPYVEIAGV